MSLRYLVYSLCLTAATLSAQDAIKVSPDYKVEIDNAWVRVLRVKEPPHAKIPLHEHPAAVNITLTDAWVKSTGADGKFTVAYRKAGTVGYNEASKHAEENLSDEPLEALVIELKQGPAHTPPVELDPVKLADGRLADNSRKPGEIVWNEASKHQSEQMGDNTAIEVLVELK